MLVVLFLSAMSERTVNANPSSSGKCLDLIPGERLGELSIGASKKDSHSLPPYVRYAWCNETVSEISYDFSRVHNPPCLNWKGKKITEETPYNDLIGLFGGCGLVVRGEAVWTRCEDGKISFGFGKRGKLSILVNGRDTLKNRSQKVGRLYQPVVDNCGKALPVDLSVTLTPKETEQWNRWRTFFSERCKAHHVGEPVSDKAINTACKCQFKVLSHTSVSFDDTPQGITGNLKSKLDLSAAEVGTYRTKVASREHVDGRFGVYIRSFFSCPVTDLVPVLD